MAICKNFDYRALGFRGSGGHLLEKYFSELCERVKRRYAEERKSPFEFDRVREQLQGSLSEWPPPSLSTVVKRTGYARSTVIYKLPKLSKQISERFKVNQEINKVENWKVLEEQIRRAATDLMAQGIFPSLTRIRPALSVPASSHTIEKMVLAIQYELGVK